MNFDILAGSHDCFTVICVIFILVLHTVIICDMKVNKVIFSSTPFSIGRFEIVSVITIATTG